MQGLLIAAFCFFLGWAMIRYKFWPLVLLIVIIGSMFHRRGDGDEVDDDE